VQAQPAQTNLKGNPMPEPQRRLSTRDAIYLNSPGFEPYMAAGAVFVVVFTAIFIVSIKISFAWLVWPGLFVAVLVGYLVLNLLQRRERARKLAEIDAEQQADEVVVTGR
jgi:hypothetical protein